MKSRYVVILLIIAIIAGVFYWYEYRPARIRKDCFKQAEDKFYASIETAVKNGNYISDKFITLKDIFYKDCIRENGLKE